MKNIINVNADDFITKRHNTIVMTHSIKDLVAYMNGRELNQEKQNEIQNAIKNDPAYLDLIDGLELLQNEYGNDWEEVLSGFSLYDEDSLLEALILNEFEPGVSDIPKFKPFTNLDENVKVQLVEFQSAVKREFHSAISVISEEMKSLKQINELLNSKINTLIEIVMLSQKDAVSIKENVDCALRDSHKKSDEILKIINIQHKYILELSGLDHSRFVGDDRYPYFNKRMTKQYKYLGEKRSERVVLRGRATNVNVNLNQNENDLPVMYYLPVPQAAGPLNFIFNEGFILPLVAAGVGSVKMSTKLDTIPDIDEVFIEPLCGWNAPNGFKKT